MRLTDYEKAMLNGEHGEMRQQAMQALCDLASFYDVEKFVEENNVKTGIVTVQSEHTTCSVFFEEMVHDFDIKGDEYLQVDLNKGLEKIYPNQESDGVYYQ